MPNKNDLKDIRLNARIDKHTRKRLGQLARETGKSMSEILRELVAQADPDDLQDDDSDDQQPE